jgi:hypothetical protein
VVVAPTGQSEFRQKVLLSMIDKLVFGLLIALAGFILNLVLDHYRSGQETRAAIAHLRVNRIAVVASAFDTEQRAIDALAHSAGNFRYGDEKVLYYAGIGGRRKPRAPELGNQNYDTLARQVTLQRRHVIYVLEENRFWIGEKTYPDFLRYEAREADLYRAYGIVSEVETDELAMTLRPLRRGDLKRSDAESAHKVFVSAMKNLADAQRRLDHARVDVFDVMSSS